MKNNKLLTYLLACLMVVGLFSITPLSYAENCDDCPAHNPCKITIPAGDRCNTCQYEVHCSEDQWYRNPTVKCTTIDCTRFTPIENPFEEDP